MGGASTAVSIGSCSAGSVALAGFLALERGFGTARAVPLPRLGAAAFALAGVARREGLRALSEVFRVVTMSLA
jgi:hypothetical protein